jgi:hypothetical protein
MHGSSMAHPNPEIRLEHLYYPQKDDTLQHQDTDEHKPDLQNDIPQLNHDIL